jgi:hypothetical protein
MTWWEKLVDLREEKPIEKKELRAAQKGDCWAVEMIENVHDNNHSKDRWFRGIIKYVGGSVGWRTTNDTGEVCVHPMPFTRRPS